jgi:predicted glycosyltransferase
LFADKHWVDMIDPDELTAKKLVQRITHHFKHPAESNQNDPPNLNGASAAAALTLSVLASKNERVLN